MREMKKRKRKKTRSMNRVSPISSIIFDNDNGNNYLIMMYLLMEWAYGLLWKPSP